MEGSKKLRLNGMAQKMFFEHYAVQSYSDASTKFLRFMCGSKSGCLAVQNYLHSMTLSQTGGTGYCFRAEKSNAFHKEILLDDGPSAKVLELIKPQKIKLFIGADDEVDRFEKIFPFLEGISKLHLDESNPNVLPFIQKIAPKVTELTCPIDTLSLPNFPHMNLETFRLRSNYFNQNQNNIGPLFKYTCKTVDLTDLDNSMLLNRIEFGDDGVKNDTIESLHLKAINPDLNEGILNFVKKFHEHTPKLQEIHLSLEANSTSLEGTQFAAQLINIHKEIETFKEQVQCILKKLIVNFTGETFVVESEEDQEDWTEVLRSNEHFKEATFKTNNWRNEETVEMGEFEKTSSFMFSLTFKATLSTLDEGAYQQVIDDNVDFDDLDIDEGEVDYDYSDMSDDYDD
ncbi:hypothetical protein M3Y97_00746400 [Aphelenchoides bicaudatus]|nr:hypothetical protein M3Y97_00746400 [Aphelenchoides bicaudatus]